MSLLLLQRHQLAWMNRIFAIPCPSSNIAPHTPTSALANILLTRYMRQLRQRDLRRAPNRPGTLRQLRDSEVPAPAPAMRGKDIIPPALRLPFPSGFEEYAPLLTAVRWWWRQAAGHGRETPFLDIRLDEHEARLTEVDMYGAGPVGADGGEEVLRFQAVGYVI